jgi:hypothetical protein
MAHAATQYIYIPSLNSDGKVARLTLTADTNSRKGISSTAHVEFEHADGFGVSFLMCGDFRKLVLNVPSVRGTQKAIDTAHASAFTPEVIESLKAEAIAFYDAKVAKEANMDAIDDAARDGRAYSVDVPDPKAPGESIRYTVPAKETIFPCKWFLSCENPATTTTTHPTLGEVPTCERCNRFAGGDSPVQPTIAAPDHSDPAYCCQSCGKPEGECSANPCAAVIADREDEPTTAALLEAAATAQTAYWDALRLLEAAIGVDLEDVGDLSGLTVEDVIASFGPDGLGGVDDEDKNDEDESRDLARVRMAELFRKNDSSQSVVVVSHRIPFATADVGDDEAEDEDDRNPRPIPTEALAVRRGFADGWLTDCDACGATMKRDGECPECGKE